MGDLTRRFCETGKDGNFYELFRNPNCEKEREWVGSKEYRSAFSGLAL